MNIPLSLIQQTARHEAAHAVIGFVERRQFSAEGIYVAAVASFSEWIQVGKVEFGDGLTANSRSVVRTSLAGPLYEHIMYPDTPSETLRATCIHDSRTAATALTVLATLRKVTLDIPLRDSVFQPGTFTVKEWAALYENAESTDWQPIEAFHNRFVESLDCLQADEPSLEKGQHVSTLALLKWFAVQTRQIVERQRSVIEALATELVTEKRLNAERYVISGPELESFLRTRITGSISS